MRSLLILGTLLALIVVIYGQETEKRKKFVIVVKEKDDQNTTSKLETATSTEKAETPKYRIRKPDFKKKQNITDPKVMYKFEFKDGRMKFQRDVDEKIVPESQTEAYETTPENEIPVEPSYSFYNYPVMYYKLCPVPFPPNYIPQGNPDQLVAAQSYRGPKKYVPSSVTSTVPSNYEYGHSYQQFHDSTHANSPKYQIHYQYNTPAYLGHNQKHNLPFYSEFSQGIEHPQQIMYVPQYVPNTEQINNNLYGSFVDPISGSYQITVGHNKFTDTSLNSNQPHVRDIYNMKYKPKSGFNTQPKFAQSPVSNTLNIQENVANKNKENNFINTKGDEKIIYYMYEDDADLNAMFESLKLNGIKQHQIVKRMHQ